MIGSSLSGAGQANLSASAKNPVSRRMLNCATAGGVLDDVREELSDLALRARLVVAVTMSKTSCLMAGSGGICLRGRISR